MAIQTLRQQFTEDVEALEYSLNSEGPLPLANIRLLGSTVLRKWICEGAISKLARELGETLLLPTIESRSIFEAVRNAGDCEYLMIGGAPIDGFPVHLVYSSSSPSEGRSLYGLGDARMVWMKPAAFQSQRRVWFEGRAITRNDIIKYAANKMGGIHYDQTLDGILRTIDRARERFQFGSEKAEFDASYSDLQHQHFMVVSNNTPVPWDCVAVEILTACEALTKTMVGDKFVWRKLNGSEQEFREWMERWVPGTAEVVGAGEMKHIEQQAP